MPSRRARVSESPEGALRESLAQLRKDLELPESFPPAVLAEAERVAASVPVDPADAALADLRDVPFVTIDPEGSTDLDQALHLERTGDGVTLQYAIADVPAYVEPGGAIDAEARERGQTMYAPDGRIPLHPEALSEDAASLLPEVDRRAYVWTFALDDRAVPTSTTLTRAVIRSRKQWSYPEAQRAADDVAEDDVFGLLRWFGEQRLERERERGGASLNMPSIEIVRTGDTYRLERRAILPVEAWNAQVSLLTGMAAADLMLAGKVGILRTMPEPPAEDIAAFRERVKGLGLPWPEDVDYGEYLRRLDASDPAALAAREAASALFRGAGYEAFDGEVPADPVQSAIAAPYAHATAPLRRLVDRWVLVICAALSSGTEVPGWARESLAELPDRMASSGSLEGRLQSEATDRVEAATLHGREGERFSAIVTSQRGDDIRVQIEDPPITANVGDTQAEPGSSITVTVARADIATGQVTLRHVPDARPL